MVIKMKNKTTGEKTFIISSYILLAIIALVTIIPLISVVVTSFVSSSEIARRGQFILWPEKFDTSAYALLFRTDKMFSGYRNTLIVVIGGTALSMLFSICLAYPLSKKELRFRNGILGMLFFTMLFSGGMVPNYILIKEFGMLNSFSALILPYICNTWNILLLRNFFYAIPNSLEEAAELDGANQLQTIVKVILPLSLPSLATISMFYGVSYWNAWFPGVMYITKANLLPIQNIMRSIIISATGQLEDMGIFMDEITEVPTSHTLKCASIVVGTLPILCIYPFIQKYFVKGVMVGSVKG